MTNQQKRLNRERELDLWELDTEDSYDVDFVYYGTFEDLAYSELMADDNIEE